MLQSFTNSSQLFTNRVVAVALAVLLTALCLIEIGRIVTALQFQPAPVRTAAPPVETQELVRRVAAAQLFGRADVTVSSSHQRPPETSLQLTLRGAFAGVDATQGSAIIELQQGTTRSVRAGEAIDRDIRLREVHSDHVVLERGGQLESLYFPQPGAIDPYAVAASPSAEMQALMPSAPASTSQSEETQPAASGLSPDERREMIRQRLEELRQRAASNRTLP